ncbi:MAG: TolC family protein [Planctomycetota bacterium]|jgi:outer membrane protein TolC
MTDGKTIRHVKSAALAGVLALTALPAASCRQGEAVPGRPFVGPAAAPPRAEVRSPAAGLVPASGPLELSVPEAILVALEGNRALAIEKLGPAISRTYVQTQRADFDPSLGVDVSRGRTVTDNDTGRSVSDGTSAEVSGNVYLPTGTSVELSADCDITDSSAYSDQHETRLGLSVTQSLLRGMGLSANLAALKSARLDVLSSEYELRGFAEALVADVEGTCWDYALAGREIKIVTDSLKLAEQQLAETGERVKVGKLAETELAAAQAEVAGRREALIEARSKLAKTRLTLIRLLCPGGRTDWDREVRLKYPPAVPKVKLDPVEKHVEVALRMRPDLNQARLALSRGELDVVATRNGLLPQLDLFVTLGATGYASSFGKSVEDLDGDSYEARFGLRLDLPLGNRAARASHRRALLRLEEARQALTNMRQLVELDVRTAYIEVGRAREQISATAATRKAQEEALRAETAKFRVGKSTAFLVAQAQRDLLVSQIAEVRAVVSYLKALVDLHRLEGSLLERRGIKAPGAAGER